MSAIGLIENTVAACYFVLYFTCYKRGNSKISPVLQSFKPRHMDLKFTWFAIFAKGWLRTTSSFSTIALIEWSWWNREIPDEWLACLTDTEMRIPLYLLALIGFRVLATCQWPFSFVIVINHFIHHNSIFDLFFYIRQH